MTEAPGIRRKTLNVKQIVMIDHKIFARHSGVKACDRLHIAQIKRCIRKTLDLEGVDIPCEVSVLITDDYGIQKLNYDFRRIDKPTDVLSFPMQSFSPPGWADPGPDAIEGETGTIPLGEIVISAQRVRDQCHESGRKPDMETVYLTIHSVLHLLGYDHIDEAEGKRLMRAREKNIMSEMSNIYD